MQFLRHVVRSRSFAQADLDTALIQREQAVLFNQEPLGLPLAAAAAIAQALLQEKAAGRRRPVQPARRLALAWAGGAAFRSSSSTANLPRPSSLTCTTARCSLTVGNVSGGAGLHGHAAGDCDIHFAGQRLLAAVYAHGESDHVFSARGATQIMTIDLLAHAGEAAAEGGRLTAPMPGKVVSFAVKAGDKVSKGQALAVMEAMKMEHTIAAPADGMVAELMYAPGDQVAEGATAEAA